MVKLTKFLKKAMVISMEDQVTYRNRTVQVGPHVLVVTCALVDVTVPRLRNKLREWTLKHGGHTIWPSTESLSSYLVASKVAERRRVLELGAGMGVCGLIAHKTGAAAVVLTDGDSDAMKYLNENIMANSSNAGEGKFGESKAETEEGDDRSVYARVLRWGDIEEVRTLMEVLETGHFDIVLGADVIYPEDPKKETAMPLMDVKIRDLFATAAAALREGGTFLLAHEIRTDMKDVLDLMERHAVSTGFGPPQAVRMVDGPERVVLSLEFRGKASPQAAEKSEEVDDASQGWRDLTLCLEATGFGSAGKKRSR